MSGNEPRLVDDYFRHLASELGHYNEQRTQAARMRLRAAVHHGLVELADNGFAGTAVVVTARLLNSRPLYDALDAHPHADLALILSDDVFRSAVAGGHTALRPSDFTQVAVKEKEYESTAWLTVPTLGRPRPAADEHPTSADRPHHAPADTNGGMRNDYRADRINVTNMTGPVDARNAVFGFGNTDA
ncbi:MULTISPECIES: hypothetical protein [Streptomyces]|uniref:Uncharacterized protein n=2 Tax=Streptomyces TaxID=1883 RepID=A0ABV9IST5_9ACTN